MRAYLSVGTIVTYCPACARPGGLAPPRRFPPEADAALYIPIVNTGKTPAQAIEINATTYGYAKPLPTNYSFDEMTDADVMADGVAPDPTHPLTVAMPYAALQLVCARGQLPVRLGTGKIVPWFLYTYGHISFTDVFGRRHTTLYCMEYTPATGGTRESWTQCEQHNGQDDGY
jgi:hypothetical protein